MFKSVPLLKIGSGVAGLDEVLDGGYPDGRTTLLKGGPGAGKTLFAVQFLLQNALTDMPGLFVTFEEGAEAVRTNAATLGWDLRALEAKGLLFVHHASLDAAAVVNGLFSLKALMAVLGGKTKAMGARLVVLDAIDILLRRFEDASRAREELSSLHGWLTANAITAVLSVKSNDDAEMLARFGFLDYMADCVVQLDHRVMDQISTRRLRVLKYRGSAFGTNEYPYVIGAGGVSLVPIASALLAHRPLGAPQSSGNKELDAALNGGYRRGSCILVAGTSGTGKTTIACTFALAACARGEKVLFLSYEEAPEALASAVRSAGLELEPAIRAGKLALSCRLPESAGSDEHLFLNLRAMKSFQPDHVVVDAVSACHRMGSGKAAFDYCMRLVSACKESGITCLLTNQTMGSADSEGLSGLGFSSLVDAVVYLRFEESRDELHRSLLIVKARGSRHSRRVYELSITDHGIVLGARKSSGGGTPAERRGRTSEGPGGAP